MTIIKKKKINYFKLMEPPLDGRMKINPIRCAFSLSKSNRNFYIKSIWRFTREQLTKGTVDGVDSIANFMIQWRINLVVFHPKRFHISNDWSFRKCSYWLVINWWPNHEWITQNILDYWEWIDCDSKFFIHCQKFHQISCYE